MEPNFAIAYQMIAHCAALGHPPCQAERAFHLNWGLLPAQPSLQGPPPAVRPLPFVLSEPRPLQTVLHEFFAAAGGDDVAQVREVTMSSMHNHTLLFPSILGHVHPHHIPTPTHQST